MQREQRTVVGVTVAMLLVVPLVAVAPQACSRGLRTAEIVPMPVLMSCLNHKMWGPAAGIAERTALAPRDLVVTLSLAGFPTPVVAAESWSPVCPMLAAVAENWSPVCPNHLPAAVEKEN